MPQRVVFFSDSHPIPMGGKGRSIHPGNVQNQINNWLSLNPKVRIVDIKMCSHAAANPSLGFVFELFALLIYDAPDDCAVICADAEYSDDVKDRVKAFEKWKQANNK